MKVLILKEIVYSDVLDATFLGSINEKLLTQYAGNSNEYRSRDSFDLSLDSFTSYCSY